MKEDSFGNSLNVGTERVIGAFHRALPSKHELISFLLPLLVYVLSLKKNLKDTHGLNVLTQYALWTTGGPSLGPVSNPIIPNWPAFFARVSTDLIVSNGQYFSVYAPGLSYLSYPFGVVGFLLDGGRISLDSSAILTDEGFVAICAALAALVLYKFCRMYAPSLPSLLASLTLAFGTIAWPFATELFDHDAAMLFSLLAVYSVVRLSTKENSGDERKYVAMAVAGASLGIACTLEYLSAVLILPLSLFLAYRKKLGILSGALLGATFSIGPIFDLTYNRLVTGNFLTFPEDLWTFSTNPLIYSNRLTVTSRFAPSQLLNVPLYDLVSPYRGLLLISPVLLVGIYGLYRMYRSGRYRGDALLLLSLFLLGLLPYSMWTPWDGGGSFGPRFLIDVIPYLVLPIAFALSETRVRYAGNLRVVVFPSLFVISSFMAGAAAFTTASPPAGGILDFQPIQQSIPLLLRNEPSAWWAHFDPSISVVVVPFCFILIWATGGMFLPPVAEMDRRVVALSNMNPRLWLVQVGALGLITGGAIYGLDRYRTVGLGAVVVGAIFLVLGVVLLMRKGGTLAAVPKPAKAAPGETDMVISAPLLSILDRRWRMNASTNLVGEML